MLHHEAKYFGDYLVNGWQQVSRMLSAWNVRAVFTGHFHAQDVVERKTTNGQFLYDIETGSLVSFPSPVRTVEITGEQKMVIATSFIRDLPSFAARGIDFWEYSKKRLAAGIARTVAGMMTGVGISQKEAAFIAQQVADASLAHFRGADNDVTLDLAPAAAPDR